MEACGGLVSMTSQNKGLTTQCQPFPSLILAYHSKTPGLVVVGCNDAAFL
jgi:hypothetical protein